MHATFAQETMCAPAVLLQCIPGSQLQFWLLSWYALLRQFVLMSLVDMQDTLTKLKWIQSIALALDPKDPLLAPHVKHILETLYSNLQRVSAESSNREAANQAHMCLHLINSLLHSCAP